MQEQRKGLYFDGENFYIGIDVHLKNWYITIMDERLELKRFSMKPCAKALYKYLDTHYPGGQYYSAYEAGFCGLSVHYELMAAGIVNIVVNPSDIPCTDKERDQKTDAVDASKLARSLRNKELKPIYIHRWQTLQDRALLRVRKSLVKDMTCIKSRIKGMLYYFGISYPPAFELSSRHWSKAFINWLKEEVLNSGLVGKEAFSILIEEFESKRDRLAQITRAIRNLSQEERYKENFNYIRSVPGIGTLSAMFFLVNIEEINRFENRDKFAGYLGLKPTRHQSSENDPKGHLTNRGQKELRTLLVENSWISIRCDPALTKKFGELCKRMNANKAIIHIARKVANRIYYVLKNKQFYVNGLVQ